MLNNIDAVIFDMDGTLIDSMWIWPSVDDDYMKKYQLTMPEGFFDAMEGKSYTETAQLFADTFPTLQRSIEEIKQEWTEMAYERYRHEVTLKAGAMDFLMHLKERNVKCGIATSNTRELVDITLQGLKIDPFFDAVRTSCEVPKGKPAPDVYLKVADDLHIEPSRCLVFEDVPAGIMAGKNAGMKVCGIDDALSRHQEARKKELANYYIYDYYDIKKQTYEVLV